MQIEDTVWTNINDVPLRIEIKAEGLIGENENVSVGEAATIVDVLGDVLQPARTDDWGESKLLKDVAAELSELEDEIETDCEGNND